MVRGADGNPIVHKVWRGERAERAAACLAREAPAWIAALKYRFYPGPNSNTFGDVMLRRCKLAASLPSTAIGKDWRGLIGGGLTSERTGEIDATLGIRIGNRDEDFGFASGNGYFVGVSYRELAGAKLVGLVIGYSIDGGTAPRP